MHFRDAFADYKKAGAVILGVSPDDSASHAKFAEKFDLPFPLLADHDKTSLRGLRSLEREKHVRQEVHGRGTNDVRDRQEGDRRQDLSQGQGRRA